MNCHKAEELLSRALDGELPAEQRAALDSHVASCASCRALCEDWTRNAALLRDQKIEPAQTAEALWADVQRTIRLQGERPGVEVSVFGWRLQWAGVMIFAILLGVSAFGLLRLRSPQVETTQVIERGVEVEFVETDVPGASPMVYQDAETGWTVIWVAGMEGSGEAGQGS